MSSMSVGNHTTVTSNSWALMSWFKSSRRCTARQSPSPVYEASAPVDAAHVSIPEVLMPARMCTTKTGGNVKNDGEVREETGRSSAVEGRGDVTDSKGEYACGCQNE